MLVFEREARPTEDSAKSRVELRAGVRWNEEVTRAILGDMSSCTHAKEESKDTAATEGGNLKERKYLEKKKKVEEEQMIMEVDQEEKKKEVEVAEPKNDKETIRNMITESLSELKRDRQHR